MHYMPDDVRVPAHGLYLRVLERLALTGMTKTELRKRTGVARSTIDSWATQTTPPQARTVNKVADALGIDRVEALRLAGILDGAPAAEDQLTPLDEFERVALAADRPYAAKLDAIRRHRQLIAELGIKPPPALLRHGVRHLTGGRASDDEARGA